MLSRHVARVVLSGFLLACSGGGDGKAPTSPSTGSLSLDGLGALVAIPVADEGVVVEVHILFDGQVVERQIHSPPAQGVGFGFRDEPITPGNHTIAIRIIRQTVTTQLYEFSGVLSVQKPGAQKNFTIPDTQKRLREGESVEFKFDATL